MNIGWVARSRGSNVYHWFINGYKSLCGHRLFVLGSPSSIVESHQICHTCADLHSRLSIMRELSE